MNYLLVLSLVCLLSASVKGLPLNAICVQDHFKYEGRTVNAYLKVPLETTFEAVKNFIIDIPAGFDAVLEVCPSDAQDVLRIKDDFNKMILGIYTEKYLSDLEPANIATKLRQLLAFKQQTRKVYQTIFILTGGLDVTNEVQEEFQGKFAKAHGFLDALSNLKQEMVTEIVLNKSELNSTLDHLGEPQAGQEAIFDKRSSDAFYSQSLYKLDNVRLNNESKLFFNKQVTATVFYTLYMPFVTQEPVKDGNCTNATALPLFYRNKKTQETA